MRTHFLNTLALSVGLLAAGAAQAVTTVSQPYLGITYTSRIGEQVQGRTVNMNVLQIDLNAPGIGFKLTGAAGSMETVRQSTLGALNTEQAQFAVNSHFFLPFPSASIEANLVGFAASQGKIISGFEAPVQSYALVTNAPAINISPSNQASIVHVDPNAAGGRGVLENVALGNAFAGSAQIVTNGVVTIPVYKDTAHPDGLLTPGSASNYSNTKSWYEVANARTVIGLSSDLHTLVIATVDNAKGSTGMTVGQLAQTLVSDYGVYNALNMDGGGSTTLAMRDPSSGLGRIVNNPSDATVGGRLVGSNIAIFAQAVPEPGSYALMLAGLLMLAAVARRRAQ